MKRYDFLIVGAGLYGCTIAERLHSHGYKVLVIDKRDRIGGNCASVDMNGIDVHLYGPHVFHTSDKQVWNYITQFGYFRQFTHKVLSRHGDRLYSFPINLKTIMEVFGKDSLSVKSKYIETDCSLEEWCINEIGETLYEMFIKGYTEKQWHCDPKLLPASIIKRIPVRSDFNDSYFNDYYQGVPHNGYNNLFINMLEGIDVELNTDFFTGHSVNKVIYTGPIDRYFDYKYGILDWRSLKFCLHEHRIKDFQGISVMHFPEKKYPHTRVTEFKHFNPFNESFDKNYTVTAVEYPCIDNDNPYYPVENSENIDKYMKYSEIAQEEKNILFAGRLGTYKYNDMDVTVKNALEDFDKIIRGELF
jgi:UDP-galactopyranose mutase